MKKIGNTGHRGSKTLGTGEICQRGDFATVRLGTTLVAKALVTSIGFMAAPVGMPC
jgi:hypothetical protein